ncbi:MAG: 2-oxoacid:acceptor oxidoreductase subunit alpha [Spirochaetes bacterium]|nr:2-oxoacid:acceptor oxidoreductase subunit alpha [Spirochaetota bacterium]
MIVKEEDVSILLSGAAGQGLNTVEDIILSCLKKERYFVFGTKEYMSRIRGGNNSTYIRIASEIKNSITNKVDFIFLINRDSLKRHIDRIYEDTYIFYIDNFLTEEDNDNIFRSYLIKKRDLDENYFSKNFIKIDYSFNTCNYSFGILYPIFISGLICNLFGAKLDNILGIIKEKFSKKDNKTIEENLKYSEEGYNYGYKFKDKIIINIEKNLNDNYDFISGAQSVAMGAIRGGCNFISSYPMSPATTVFTYLSKYSKSFDVKFDNPEIKRKKIVVDQAEDEIAAINMAIGASYAGARSIVSTSGGGFALMTEAVSLAAMTETPIVIHIGQRPGPATGLPTRTEEGDFNLVRYSGHGEFPRVILAPSTPEQAYYLTAKAFYLSQKYQIPVFILTSQYFLDSIFTCKRLDDLSSKFDFDINSVFIVKTEKDYIRYRLTDDGISPRGVPGYGDGVVRVDSDEHDVYGHITESGEVRKIMVEKRNKKINKIFEEFISPEFYGDENYDILLVCWGSLFNIVKEVYNILKNRLFVPYKKINNIKKFFENIKIGIIHFSQVYPIPSYAEILKYFQKTENIILVEQNYSGQFGNYLKEVFNFEFSLKILKYDGYIMTPEEIIDKLYLFAKTKIII